jgi:hypothetical protein
MGKPVSKVAKESGILHGAGQGIKLIVYRLNKPGSPRAETEPDDNETSPG